MKKLFLNKKGFTLIELIVAVTILVIVLSMAFGIFIQSSGVQAKITRKIHYQDAATTIISTIKSRIKDTNYLTVTSSESDSAAVATGGTGRVFAKGDYDGIYVQRGSDAPTKMYGIKDLDGMKIKMYYKCEPAASDGRYSLLTVKLAFYNQSVDNATITADTNCEKAEYVHDSTIYLQNLAFGIKISDSTIEAEKNANNYDTMTDDEKEAYENNMMNLSAAGFEGRCIKYRVMS